MSCCDIFDVFDEENNLIKEYTYWKVLMRKKYMSLGNCVVITKEHHESFSELNMEEMAEFTTLVKDLESALRRAFQYDKINWLMLMMKDKHTHFHVIPRYASPREFGGKEWVDEGWPSWPVKSEVPQSKEYLTLIRDELKKYFD